jgi:AcrR family transcriptional regulator
MTAVRRRPELPRAFIEANRRKSLARAAARVAHEAGVHAVTVTLICREAHSARNTFYGHFHNVEDCLRHGIREALEYLFAPIREGGAEGSEWLPEVERAITGFYAAAAAEPLLAELLLVHSAGFHHDDGGSDLDTGLEALAALLAGGRAQAAAAGGPVPLAEDYLTRAIVSLAALKLRQDEGETLPEHSREMTLLVGSVYLGNAETGRILYRSFSSPK